MRAGKQPEQANEAKAELQALRDARYAALASRARTEPAYSLVDHLFAMMVGVPAKGGRGDYQKTKLQKRRAVEGLIGDLLLAQSLASAKGWVYRSLGAGSFAQDEDVKYRAFVQVIARLEKLGLMERRAGFQNWAQGQQSFGDGLRMIVSRYATRFRATPKLLMLSEHHGVPVPQAHEHFILDLPTKPLQLRAHNRSVYGEKIKGRPMTFDPTPQTMALEADVLELNKFFDGFELRGGTHRGFVRIFNEGDDSAFDWNKGGRLYSQGHENYQLMAPKLRRLMTIGGEAVSEIDIRASYLTIFHGWFGEQLDLSCDPYVLPGLGQKARGVVKRWFLATFGSAGHLTKWPPKMVSEYREQTGHELGKAYPVKLLREKATKSFPLLGHWGEHKGGWADLMFTESVAMISTMIDLKRDHSVPSLSVHDSLIVPASKRQLAEGLLAAQYRLATGVEPKLVV